MKPSLAIPVLTPEQERRLWAKVAKGDGCWEWTACRNRDGYGKVGVGGVTYMAHRVTYTLACGRIPEGFELDHVVCGNKSCVRPGHLEAVLVAGRENSRRYQASKTHCKSGHAWTPENTLPSRSGRRRCRECSRLSAAANYQRYPLRHRKYRPPKSLAS